MIEVELRKDDPSNTMGDYEAWAIEGFTPVVEIVAFSADSYGEALRRLVAAMDELAIPGDIHVAQWNVLIKR
jgi:hypothetical protein